MGKKVTIQSLIEQRCEVCWKDPYPAGKRRYYGLRFIRNEAPRA